MLRIIKSVWVTAQEAVSRVAYFRSKEDLRITRRSPDGQQALLEWIEWETPEGGKYIIDADGFTRLVILERKEI